MNTKLQDLKDDITNAENQISKAMQSLRDKWGIDIEVKAKCNGDDKEIIAVNVMSGIIFSNKN